MKIQLPAIFFGLLALASCSMADSESAKKRRTPKALEDKVSSVELLSRRASEDLLDALYNELADQTPELKALEARLDKLALSKPDSTKAFKSFNTKNESYYALTNKIVLQIQDSGIKKQLQQLLKISLQNYHDSISIQQALMDSIEAKQISTNDLHTALKIVRTLPLIERYQRESISLPAPLQHYFAELDSVRVIMDSLLLNAQDSSKAVN